MDSSGGIAAERGQSRSFSDRPSSLQSLRQDFSQALGRARGSDLEKSPRAPCCMCGKLLALRSRHVFFSFF